MEVMALSVRLKEEGASTVKSAIDKLKGSMKDLNLTTLVAGAGLGVLVKQAVDMADQMRLLEGRLKLVTSSTAELQAVQDALRESANRTRSDYAASVELFARVARSTRDLGIAQSDLLRFTELTQMAIKTSGASSVEAAAALTQLSQGLAAGTLRGEEFNSVMEQTPGLALAIAGGLGVGVGELRALAQQGKLTAQEVIDAVLKMDEVIRSDFALAPVTVADSFVVLKNAIRDALGEINTATGATSNLASSIMTLGKVIGGVASNIDTIVIAAKSLAIALLAPFAAQAVAAITGYIGKMQLMIATQRQTIAMARLEATAAANTARALIAKGASADAVSAAQLRAAITGRNLTLQTSLLSRAMLTATTVARGLWTAIGGPIGAVVIGIAAVSAAFDKLLQRMEENAEAVDKASRENPAYIAALEAVTKRREALTAAEKQATDAAKAAALETANRTENLAKLAGLTEITRGQFAELINAERAVAAELANGNVPLSKRIELLQKQQDLLSAAAGSQLRGERERMAAIGQQRGAATGLGVGGLGRDVQFELSGAQLFKKTPDLTKGASAEAAEKARANAIDLSMQIRDTLAENVGNGIVEGIAAGFERGFATGNIKEGFKALAGTMLSALGSAMIRFGVASQGFAKLQAKIMEGMTSLNPAVTIAGAMKMIALGAALKGAAQGMFGGGGGGGGGGIAAVTPVTPFGIPMTGQGSTNQIIFGQTSATTAAGMTPRSATNVTIIGPDDPKAQRAIEELIRKGQTRGTLG